LDLVRFFKASDAFMASSIELATPRQIWHSKGNLLFFTMDDLPFPIRLIQLKTSARCMCPRLNRLEMIPHYDSQSTGARSPVYLVFVAAAKSE
jgi:hypothetical protein